MYQITPATPVERTELEKKIAIEIAKRLRHIYWWLKVTRSDAVIRLGPKSTRTREATAKEGCAFIQIVEQIIGYKRYKNGNYTNYEYVQLAAPDALDQLFKLVERDHQPPRAINTTETVYIGLAEILKKAKYKWTRRTNHKGQPSELQVELQYGHYSNFILTTVLESSIVISSSAFRLSIPLADPDAFTRFIDVIHRIDVGIAESFKDQA